MWAKAVVVNSRYALFPVVTLALVIAARVVIVR